jgi:ribosomal protein S18 acetylase RimI-like enzyme
MVIAENANLDEFNKKLIKEANSELVFLYCNKKHLPIITKTANAAFIEHKVTYEMPISANESVAAVSLQRVSNFENINEVYYLSLEAGKYSRFRLDPNMKSFEFEKLYFEWVFKSILGQFDHDVYLFKEDGKTVGLLTLKVTNETAHIGLISSHKDYQGRGIGKNMITFAKNYASQKKCKLLSVATQESNHVAMKFYQKNGFTVKQLDCILHAWRFDQK